MQTSQPCAPGVSRNRPPQGSLPAASILNPLRVGLRLLALALPIALLPSEGAAADSRAVNTDPTRPTTYQNWMRWLPDNTRLSVMSVPGTHDAMALHGGPIAETQSMPLLEQLRSGIRYLDIRARHVLDRFVITHGVIVQDALFEDVLRACNRFLQENPTETLVMHLSDQGAMEEYSVTRSYWETFRWYRDESGLGGYIHRPASAVSSSLTLGSIRGKILITTGLSADRIGCYQCGLNYDSIAENEHGEVPTAFAMDSAWEAVVGQALVVDAGDAAHFYGNSLAGGSGGVYPIDLANGLMGHEGMNYRFLRYLFTGNQRRMTGLINYDFPGAGLIAATLAQNLKLATNPAAYAPDFVRIFRDLAYSATHEGVYPADASAVQLQWCLQHLLTNRHWSVIAGSVPGGDSWGYALEAGGLTAQSDTIDGYIHLAIGAASLDPSLSSLDLPGYWTALTLTPLSGDTFARARGALGLLRNRFPQARWNVVVKRAPFDAGNWAARLDASVSATTSVVDDGWVYSYTAWATSGTNRPPVARPGGPYLASEGTPVTFDAGASSDPTGDLLQYRWDLDGDGTWDTDFSYDPTVTTTYPDNGTPRPRIEVVDGVASAVEKVSVTVANLAPRLDVAGAVITGPDRSFNLVQPLWDPGADRWDVLIDDGDGTPNAAFHLATRDLPLSHAYAASGYYAVTVELRDEDGGNSVTRFHVLTDIPVLRVDMPQPGRLELSWPEQAAPFLLESSAPGVGMEWEPVLVPPAWVDGRRVIPLDAIGTGRLFRLRLAE